MSSYYKYFFEIKPTNPYPLLTQLAAEISLAVSEFSVEFRMRAFAILWCILAIIVSLIVFCDLMKMLLRWSWGTVTVARPTDDKAEEMKGLFTNCEEWDYTDITR